MPLPLAFARRKAQMRGSTNSTDQGDSQMNFTHPFLDPDGDKLREECGIFGVIGTPDAAAITARSP